ncbi:MAG: hypothetical protein WCJ40_20540, partial [Planctomycetota bacterium]
MLKQKPDLTQHPSSLACSATALRGKVVTFISNQPTIRVDHRIKLKELCETAGLSELSIFA